MDKHYLIGRCDRGATRVRMSPIPGQYSTYEEAKSEAMAQARANQDCEFVIYEAVSHVVASTPPVWVNPILKNGIGEGLRGEQD